MSTKTTRLSSLFTVTCLIAIVVADAMPIRAQPPARPPMGLGFLLTRETERIIPLLTAESDFLEVVLGPGKIGWVKSLPPPARTMCIAMSLADLAETIGLLKKEGIRPDRVYLAYNPERRSPRQMPVTPDEELADLAGAITKARDLAADYGAPLAAGPGLYQMETQEELYPVLARLCDIWMIQTQRLQAAADTGLPVTVDEYAAGVRRIVGLLRQGNPNIRVFVQIIPGVGEAYDAAQIAACLRAIGNEVEAAAIYGGDVVLIGDVFGHMRRTD